MRKLILAAFLFVSTMTTNTFADGLKWESF